MSKTDLYYAGVDLSHLEVPAMFSCGATTNIHGELMMWGGGTVKYIKNTVVRCNPPESYDYRLHDDVGCGEPGLCTQYTQARWCFQHTPGCVGVTEGLPDGYF